MLKSSVIILILIASAALSANASIISFNTPGGATNSVGYAVDASATLATNNNGTITVTLNNLEANPHDATQVLSGFFFSLSSVPTTALNTTSTPSGSLIGISDTLVVTTDPGPVASWTLTSSGATIHLDSLPSAADQTIIGPGPYTNANGSIAGNNGHNPFLNGTATFTLTVGGVTADTIVTDSAFAFSTHEGHVVSGVVSADPISPVPEPGTVFLTFAGIGLVGLSMFRARKQS